MKINQNISAVIVNDQLLRNENSVSESVKKLSSGLKFNAPKDNPSGMAISFKMQAQIHALNRASLNATDGTSMVETIDGAMGEMTEVLQRIRELCVQAGNDTNTLEDREAIQQEIDALKEEVNRISTATEFNNKTLMDGSLDRRTYVTDAAKTVSRFEQVSNVIISDEVQAGDYKVEIQAPAKHADVVALGNGNVLNGSTVITEELEGTIKINGSRIEITEGMTADDVFQAIRDGGELGWVNVFETNTGTPAQVDKDSLDTQGYPEVKDGYQFGNRLAFVSQNYGSNEKVTITCDNPDLATLIGLKNIVSQGSDSEETIVKEYSLETAGKDEIKDAQGNVTTPGEPAKVVTGTYTGTPPFHPVGELYINNAKVTITEDMTAADVYTAITAAAQSEKINVSLQGGSTTYNFGDALTFESQNTGADQVINILYISEDMDDYFGLKGATPAADEKMISYEYKVEKAGEDAKVSIKDRDTATGNETTIREEYTGQAIAKADGNEIVITDKSGFEISFEIRGDFAVAGAEIINIEATDIGTLQLQIGANEGQELAVRVPVLNTKSLYMDDLDVRKVTGPDRGLETMDKAIGIVTAARSLMGAYENRLDYVRSGLDETEENMTTAISRLGDTDMAAEMTEYTNANVLTQASISVLAQANDLPQQVLSLLQG